MNIVQLVGILQVICKDRSSNFGTLIHYKSEIIVTKLLIRRKVGKVRINEELTWRFYHNQRLFGPKKIYDYDNYIMSKEGGFKNRCN
jgi:hypothetical protein